MSKQALFIDLDGTLIETASGAAFPNNVDDWKFKPMILESIAKWLYKLPEKNLIIVTNQGGIPAYTLPVDFKTKLNKIQSNITAYMNMYFGTENTLKISSYVAIGTNHPSRKPEPVFAYTAEEELGLDLASCLMVGDASGLKGNHSDSDKMFAENVGIPYMDVYEFTLIYSK